MEKKDLNGKLILSLEIVRRQSQFNRTSKILRDSFGNFKLKPVLLNSGIPQLDSCLSLTQC